MTPGLRLVTFQGHWLGRGNQEICQLSTVLADYLSKGWTKSSKCRGDSKIQSVAERPRIYEKAKRIVEKSCKVGTRTTGIIREVVIGKLRR
jgi:hypothetical protein